MVDEYRLEFETNQNEVPQMVDDRLAFETEQNEVAQIWRAHTHTHTSWASEGLIISATVCIIHQARSKQAGWAFSSWTLTRSFSPLSAIAIKAWLT